MSAQNRAARVVVTASHRNVTATRLLKASRTRQPAIAKANVALDTAFKALTDRAASFDRSFIRDMYANLQGVKRSAARVRIASLRDVYAAVAWGIPNTRMAMQFEDLSTLHAKTAMLMVATRASLATEGDSEITASDLVAIDDNGYVVDDPQDYLSQASGRRASRLSVFAKLASENDDEPGHEAAADDCANLTAAAEDLEDSVQAATADISTEGDNVSDVMLPGAGKSASRRRADIDTEGDNVSDVDTPDRDPNTPLDTTAPGKQAKKKADDEGTDGGGYPIDREAGKKNQARRKSADADDDLPDEPGTTEKNVDTHYRGDPNDPERGKDLPGDGDASKGDVPVWDSKGSKNRKRRADADDDLPDQPGTTNQNVDTHYRGNPNDPQRGEVVPGMGDASKGDVPKWNSKGQRGKKADAWTDGENEPQTRPSATRKRADEDGGEDDDGGSVKPNTAPQPAAPPQNGGVPGIDSPAPSVPDDMGAPMDPSADPNMDPSMMAPEDDVMGMGMGMGAGDGMDDPQMMPGGTPNPFGMPDESGIDAILSSEILDDGQMPGGFPQPPPKAGGMPSGMPPGMPPQPGGGMPQPGMPPQPDDMTGSARVQPAQARAQARTNKLLSATASANAQVAAQDAMLRSMINSDLLS